MGRRRQTSIQIHPDDDFAKQYNGGRGKPEAWVILDTPEDGKIVCYDAKTLLKKKVFEPLKDINFFMNACTILNGTLAWDVTGTRDCSKCLDIDPEMLYGLENVSEKIA